MSRTSIVGALVFAALLAGAGCKNNDGDEIQIVRSALGGGGGPGAGASGGGGAGGDPANTVGSPIRGYTSSGSAGTSGPTQRAAIYRSPTNGTVQRRTGTPLQPAVTLGGDMPLEGAPWGYRRADGVGAVLYVDMNRHVHEIPTLGFQLHRPRLHLASDQRAPRIRRSVQRSHTGRHRVRAGGRGEARWFTGATPATSSSCSTFPAVLIWVVNDLTALSGSQFIVDRGSPFPYARSDSYNTIVYVANDAQVHELGDLRYPGFGYRSVG